MQGTAVGNVARKARPGGSALVLAGAGFALLEVAQSLVGSFDLTLPATAFLALAVPSATFLVQRLRARDGEAIEAYERGRRLTGALRLWPAGCIDECGERALGLHPARRGAGDGYIPRSADAAFREAVGEQRMVVLVGPPRSGKTRSAIEAVREAIPGDSLLVIPGHGAALRELLELDPELRHVGDPAKRRVLWLDGCARYLETIGADALLRLVEDGNRPKVTVVATTRDDAWERAISAEDQQGEAAKSLLSHAKVVELPLRLDQDELEAAWRLYPNVDFRDGIGTALASGGEGWPDPVGEVHAADSEVQPAADSEVEPLAIDSPRRARDDGLLLAYAAVTVFALLAAAGLAVSGNFDKSPPASISDQVDEAARAGGAGDRIVTEREEVGLRGGGEPSYVFGFGDNPEAVAPGEARGDEIEVWDRHGDDLDLAFRFEPRKAGVLRLRGAYNVDGDAAEELVGGYGDGNAPGELLVPFALDWDEDKSEYRLVSLATARPQLGSQPRDGEGRALRKAYEAPVRLVDRQQGAKLSLRGFPVQDFAVSPPPYRLISAYVTDADVPGENRLVEVKVSVFGGTGATPRVRPCRLAGRGTVILRVPKSGAEELDAVLLRRWSEVSKGRPCVGPALSAGGA